MTEKTAQRHVLVLGIGNILNTDEGVGVHAVRALQAKFGEPEGFELLDGGTLGLNLLPLVDDATHLIIMDAVDAGKPAGTLIELHGAEIPLFGGAKLSEHQLTFQEVLGLALLRNTLPENLVLLGVQPESLAIGIGMSPVVQKVLPALCDRAEALLASWQILPDGDSC
ncbi:MAG: HyaD/HybD family hydrogenase maturation endopeptidase [Anaerolineaceae bacterium]|nr:HyaD/HybD family hydrogenase maturation endopeptidase [Anaerolineaceae bacterium]